MDISKYSAYSIVSDTEDKSKDEIQKILALDEKIKNFKTAAVAKLYVKNRFNIKDSISNYPVCDNGYLSVIDTKDLYILNLRFLNKNNIYSFAKETRERID